MIKVLKATVEEKQKLEGFYLNGHELQFIEDAKGNWVVNTDVLNNDNFEPIRGQLEKLPLIDFKPKQIETI